MKFMMFCSLKKKMKRVVDESEKALLLKEDHKRWILVWIWRVDRNPSLRLRFVITAKRDDTSNLNITYYRIRIKKATANHSDEASVVEEVVRDGKPLVISDGKSNHYWVLDLSCMLYICLNKDLFSIYEMVSKGAILMRNKASYKIISTQTIRISIFWVIRTLDDVKHILDIKKNLISLSTLDAKGYKKSNKCGVLVMMKGQQ